MAEPLGHLGLVRGVHPGAAGLRLQADLVLRRRRRTVPSLPAALRQRAVLLHAHHRADRLPLPRLCLEVVRP